MLPVESRSARRLVGVSTSHTSHAAPVFSPAGGQHQASEHATSRRRAPGVVPPESGGKRGTRGTRSLKTWSMSRLRRCVQHCWPDLSVVYTVTTQ